MSSSTITAPERARGPSSGTVGAALRHRDFRTMWLGSFGSNIGTWMQTLVLPAYIAARTDSAMWVGLFVFAQLGPLLVLSIPGGMLADRFPRRQWMILMQAEQLVLTLVIASFVASDASLAWLFLAQLLIGIGNSLNAPAFQSTMPNLVPKEDLPGAISLNSVMINGSRVIGPTIAAVLMSRGVDASTILIINAVTYLFVIWAIARIDIPPIGRATDAQGWANFMTGIRIARERTVLLRLILGMALFSFFCLPFIGLFPQVARLNYGMHPQEATYKWLYATWGLGACLGALAIGTVLAHRDKRKLIAPMFTGFALCLAAFALINSPAPAFPIGFVLGFFYFALATSMLTIVQQNLRSSERARVMSLWFMAFGGTIAIGNLAFGPVVDAIGARTVMVFGAVCALGLGWWCDVSRRNVTFLDEDTVPVDERETPAVQAHRAASTDDSHVVAGQ